MTVTSGFKVSCDDVSEFSVHFAIQPFALLHILFAVIDIATDKGVIQAVAILLKQQSPHEYVKSLIYIVQGNFLVRVVMSELFQNCGRYAQAVDFVAHTGFNDIITALKVQLLPIYDGWTDDAIDEISHPWKIGMDVGCYDSSQSHDMNTICKFFPCLAVTLSVSLQLLAQSVPDTYCNDFRNWVKTIGSDEFDGRKPMYCAKLDIGRLKVCYLGEGTLIIPSELIFFLLPVAGTCQNHFDTACPV